MNIVYIGSGEFGLECLNGLARSDNHLPLIVTQKPQPAGRHRKPTPTPVARWAAANSTPCLETDNVNAPDVIEKIAYHRPDLLVVIAFGRKISADLINLPTNGAVNVHASLLPKYRGAAPINWAILNGETETGISIITLADTIDTGSIVSRQTTEIYPDETAALLHDRLAKMAEPLLLSTIQAIACGSAVYTTQDHSRATLAPKLKKSDGFLDFSDSAVSLQRKIRAFWPWPGAAALYLSAESGQTQRVTIAMAHVVETSNPAGLSPGTLDPNLCVICGQDALRMTSIRPAGGVVMSFDDFINGRDVQPGDAFVTITT